MARDPAFGGIEFGLPEPASGFFIFTHSSLILALRFRIIRP
jgi:hypothetical protein